MWQYNYTNENNELYHYGVPGMKWGIRRSDKGGFVPQKTKGEQPPYKLPKSERRKRWEDDNGINPHRPNGTKPQVGINKKPSTSKEERQNRRKESVKEAIAVGINAVAGLMSASLADDIFLGGAGKKTLKAVGRATVTAYMKKYKGATYVRWLD